VYLGNDPVNVHQLGEKIKKMTKHPNDVVYLRADETVPFGAFCSVIDTLRQADITNISIVTQPITDRNRTP
jgi:biopolymer transport protein ExbD/biopolymer transport protein TolR